MIEILMVFSLGFLTAILLTLAVIPFVHSRAERLAIERVEASIPISIAEVHAGKDILRAEFAMSTRRQELAIEHLRSKMMAYARELGKKTTVTGRPQSEIIGTTASLEDGSLHSTGDMSSIAIGRRRENKDVVGEKEAEIARLKRELGERSRERCAARRAGGLEDPDRGAQPTAFRQWEAACPRRDRCCRAARRTAPRRLTDAGRTGTPRQRREGGIIDFVFAGTKPQPAGFASCRRDRPPLYRPGFFRSLHPKH